MITIGDFIITTWEIIVFLNVLLFLLFGFDKLLAKKKKSRIPEIILLLLSLFFGGIGAMFGMLVFNHKTSKLLFRFLVPLSAVLNYYFFRDSFYLLRQSLEFLLEIIPQ